MPAGVAEALATMTLAVGRRVIIVEGVERWRQADVEKHLAPALSADAARDDARAVRARGGAREGSRGVHEAVKRAGGQIVAQMTVKPWELAKWAREQAARLGLSLDAAAAKALVAQVGERQQRLLRELEKLALEGEPAGRRRGRRSASRRSSGAPRTPRSGGPTALADALVAADAARGDALLPAPARAGRAAVRADLPDGPAAARRARDRRCACATGESAAEIKRGLRMPRARRRALHRRRRAHDPERLRGRSARSPTSSSTRAAARRAGRPHALARRWTRTRSRCERSRRSLASGRRRASGARRAMRAARDFLRAPVLRCSAPRLTALSIVSTSCGARSRPRRVAARDGRLEAAEVGLDRGGVAAVLEPLALGAQDPLLLGVDVGHGVCGRARRPAAPRSAVL